MRSDKNSERVVGSIPPLDAYGEASDTTSNDQDTLVSVLPRVGVDTLADNEFAVVLDKVEVGKRGGRRHGYLSERLDESLKGWCVCEWMSCEKRRRS